MRRNELFTLSKLYNKYYLLPTGQMVSEHAKPVELNETGVFIWSILENEVTQDELFSQLVHEYHVDSNEHSEFKNDILEFVNKLIIRGIVIDDSNILYKNEVANCYTISDINIALHCPTAYIDSSLNMFAASPNISDSINISVYFKKYTVSGLSSSKILQVNRDIIISEGEDYYFYTCSSFKCIKEISFLKDCSKVYVHIDSDNLKYLKNEVFLSLRTPFLIKALSMNFVMLHSASVLYNKKLYCISAPSGTGKTTLAQNWKSLMDVSIINGDLNLLKISENEKIYVFGTPWCGTSNMYSKESYELGGIILLSQSKINVASIVTAQNSVVPILARIITPQLNNTFSNKILKIVASISAITPVYYLECTNSYEAVKELLSLIDKTK